MGKEKERVREESDRETDRRNAINTGQTLIIMQDISNLIKTTRPECSHKERISTICSSA